MTSQPGSTPEVLGEKNLYSGGRESLQEYHSSPKIPSGIQDVSLSKLRPEIEEDNAYIWHDLISTTPLILDAMNRQASAIVSYCRLTTASGALLAVPTSGTASFEHT